MAHFESAGVFSRKSAVGIARHVVGNAWNFDFSGF
jgi:hypothetical protein